MLRKTIFLLILILSFSPLFSSEEKCDYLIWLNREELWISNYDWSNKNKLSYDKIDAACFSTDGKYIAYVAYNDNSEYNIKIIDYYGKEISLAPLKNDELSKKYFIVIRFVEKIFWTENNFMIIDSNSGPNGGELDIFKIDKNLNLSYLRTFHYFNCGDSIISSDSKLMACVSYIYPGEDPYYFTHPEEKLKIKDFNPYAIVYIYDTNKKIDAEDEWYKDKDPIMIKLKDTSFKNYHFSDDSKYLYIEMEEGDLYKYSIEKKELEKVKEMPKDIKIKKVPKTIKIKKGKKEIEAEVLDMYCEEQIKYCSPKVF